jgi:uracil-DNA glycosylase family 4
VAVPSAWTRLEQDVVGCSRCPRLVAHRTEVARVRRRAYRDQRYWGRPVPGFGDRAGRILLLGLAPAAHGANRTGRMFTGDRSGEFLYAALHRVGLANRPESVSCQDGLALRDAFVTATCRCAPPQNRPSRDEIERCAEYLDREIDLLPIEVVVALGRIAWDAALRRALRFGPLPRPRPAFAHGAQTRLCLHADGRAVVLLGSYHPSQQNTQTGRLTPAMLDRVLRRAVRRSGAGTARNVPSPRAADRTQGRSTTR